MRLPTRRGNSLDNSSCPKSAWIFFTNSWRESGFSAKKFSRNIKKTWSYLGKSWKSGRWCGRNSSISELNHIDYIESSLSSLVLLNPWPLYRTETENKKLPSNRQLGLFPEIGAYPSTSFPVFPQILYPRLKASQIPDTKKTGIFRSTLHVDRACSIIDRMHVVTTTIDLPHKIEVNCQPFHRQNLKTKWNQIYSSEKNI